MELTLLMCNLHRYFFLKNLGKKVHIIHGRIWSWYQEPERLQSVAVALELRGQSCEHSPEPDCRTAVLMPGGEGARPFLYSLCPASRDGPAPLEIQKTIPFIHFFIQQPFNEQLLCTGHCPGIRHPKMNLPLNNSHPGGEEKCIKRTFLNGW